MLDTLIRRMSAPQLAEARRLVDEPQPEPSTTRSVTAKPSDPESQEAASGHRVSRLHRTGLRGRSTHHDGRGIRYYVPGRFHFGRSWY
jgi:hypothetical protein